MSPGRGGGDKDKTNRSIGLSTNAWTTNQNRYHKFKWYSREFGWFSAVIEPAKTYEVEDGDKKSFPHFDISFVIFREKELFLIELVFIL